LKGVATARAPILLIFLLILFVVLYSEAHPAVATACSKAAPPQHLTSGKKLIEAGESQRAIVDCSQSVIDEYETGTGKQQSTHRCSAQNQVQAIIYTSLPADRGQLVDVMSLICQGRVWKGNPAAAHAHRLR
jgi:hypothetical protein